MIIKSLTVGDYALYLLEPHSTYPRLAWVYTIDSEPGAVWIAYGSAAAKPLPPGMPHNAKRIASIYIEPQRP